MQPKADLSGAFQPEVACQNTATYSLKHGLAAAAEFVCLLIHCKNKLYSLSSLCHSAAILLTTYSTKWYSFPQENVQSVQIVDIFSVSECCL